MRGNNAKPACISSCAQRVGVVLAHHVIMIMNKIHNVLVCNASSQSKALIMCASILCICSLMNMHESNIYIILHGNKGDTRKYCPS